MSKWIISGKAIKVRVPHSTYIYTNKGRYLLTKYTRVWNAVQQAVLYFFKLTINPSSRKLYPKEAVYASLYTNYKSITLHDDSGKVKLGIYSIQYVALSFFSDIRINGLME